MAKKRTNLLYRYLFILCFVIFGTLGIFLSFECYYFYAHVQVLSGLKDDYNRYASALKKIMRDSNKTKERLDLLESSLDDKKKKEIIELLKNDRKDDEFVLVNRELSYLKDSAHKYILQDYNNDFFKRLPEDEWMEYTDAILSAGSDESKERGRLGSAKKKNNVQKRPSKSKSKRTKASISSDISFIWPVERSKCWLSSLFGSRTKGNGQPGFHYGLDMAAFRGTPIRAAAEGIVVEARYARGYGKTILIAHNKKYKTRYAHLDKIHVYAGQKVNQGYVIGLVGSTGNVRRIGRDGSHLHFEVYSFNQRVNPLYFLMD